MSEASATAGPLTRRVVITGMGVVTASGCPLPDLWQAVRNGKSAARRLTRFDPSRFPSQIGAEILGFEPEHYMEAPLAKRLDRATQYGLAAAGLAVADAKLELARLESDRVGLVDGSAAEGVESIRNAHLAYLARGPRGVNPFTFATAYSGAGSAELALHLGIHGHAITYCSGSASGNDAVGHALRMIQEDEADVMLAGGSEAPFVDAFWAGFCVGRVMTQRNDEPLRAMRPFDRSRDGFLMGEGAAFMVLEELTLALDRGARIYAEVLGHGRSCEAYHSVLPHPDGVGAARAMEKALRRARLHASDVDYINAHGTATASNDPAETQAIKRVFGPAAYRVAVSATKPVTGHLLGAAGALETVLCALALHHQEIPPTINLTEPEPGCDLDYVPNQPRSYPIRHALNLNSGFGGRNACLVLGRSPALA